MEETLKISLDFQEKTPLTEQIRASIFHLIEYQELEKGTLLPTVRQLAAQLGVNFNTVARAYRALDAAKVITTRQGRGTYVVGIGANSIEEKAENATTLKERIEVFLKDAEKDGISRREIAQALLAATKPENRREKVQMRFRPIRKKKTVEKNKTDAEAKKTLLPRIKSVRVTKRRTSKVALFHVKQKKKRRSV